VNGAGQTLLRDMSKIIPRVVLPPSRRRFVAWPPPLRPLPDWHKSAYPGEHRGTERYHRRKPASVANATGATTAGGRREVNDGRHDVQRGTGSAVPAGLRALRDENIGAGIQCRLRHVFALNLTDQQGSRGLDPRRKWFGIAKREHDRTRPGVQTRHPAVRAASPGSGDEANAEGSACELSELGGLLFEPRSFSVAAARIPNPPALLTAAVRRASTPIPLAPKRTGFRMPRRAFNDVLIDIAVSPISTVTLGPAIILDK